MNNTCCALERMLLANTHGVVILENYPITLGHTLGIPRGHVDSFFSLTAKERSILLGLLNQTNADIDKEF